MVIWIGGRLKLDVRPFDPHRFRLQQEVEGTVVRTSDNSVWVDLDGYDARVVAERLPVNRGPGTWHAGDVLRGRVVDVSVDRRLISLGVAPFRADGFEVGAKVAGHVSLATAGGLILNLGAAQGFVPRSLLGRGPRPSPGARVYAWVERVQATKERVILSMRGFNERGYRVGEALPVQVAHKTNGTMFVRLPDGSPGRIPRSEVPVHLDPPEGSSLRARITRLDPEHRSITLSARGLGVSYQAGDGSEESPFAVLRGLLPN